ncbi:MAG: hypothetical protein ACYCU7_15590 [Acidimicrobiales bacterium]
MTSATPVGRALAGGPVRWLGVGRLAWAAVLLVAPGRLLRRAGGPGADDRRARGVVRVLGFRHLGQGVLELADRRPGAVGAGAVVDALHSASMAALAVADRRHRRPAALDGARAGSLAAVGVAVWQRAHRRPAA